MGRPHSLLLATTFSGLVLAGCAADPPGTKALFGEPQQLMAMVDSGQVGPNDEVLGGYEYKTTRTITVLCALIRAKIAEPQVNLLLNKGADVNKRCGSGDSGNLPLDVVIDQLVLRGSSDSPYRRQSTYRPEDLPLFYARAERLIGMGAETRAGKVTMAQIRSQVATGIRSNNEWHAEQQQRVDKMQAEQKQLFTGVAVVGAAVGAAALASKSQATGSALKAVASNATQDRPATAPAVAAPTNGGSRAIAAIDPRKPDPAAVKKQLQAGAMPGAASASGAPHSQEIWRDDYTNKVVATGVSKRYPNHEPRIPGDVIARNMGSESDAMALWGPQGAKKVRYSGCGSCGVGSTIRVEVDFGYIVDTHEYVRIK